MKRPDVEVRHATLELWRPFQSFLRLEASSGLVLIGAAALALVWANSPWAAAYFRAWEVPLGVSIGDYSITKGLGLWINDGLMAVFFFMVGLEIKRELIGGELSSARTATLAIAGAVGGLVVPAAIYIAYNTEGPGSAGWAVPMATDIAFALGVLALVGERVPLALKVFVTALAIIDDLAAVLVIALFYTGDLSATALVAAATLVACLVGLNRAGVSHPTPYLTLAGLLWLAVLESGVHATFAGVVAAFAIPHAREVAVAARSDSAASSSSDTAARTPTLLERIEHGIQPWVAFGILPVFALANAGVAMPDSVAGAAADPIARGVFFGLVLGKPIGVLAFVWLAIRLGLAERPEGVSWQQLHGCAWLCGIGFTMSLFISNLAFSSAGALEVSKLAVLSASLLCGGVGFTLLRTARHVDAAEDGAEPR